MSETGAGIRQALGFLAAARTDADLTAAARAAADLEGVVRVAGVAGYAFTVADLRAAHRTDWGLRWARYATGPPGRSPS